MGTSIQKNFENNSLQKEKMPNQKGASLCHDPGTVYPHYAFGLVHKP